MSAARTLPLRTPPAKTWRDDPRLKAFDQEIGQAIEASIAETDARIARTEDEIQQAQRTVTQTATASLIGKAKPGELERARRAVDDARARLTTLQEHRADLVAQRSAIDRARLDLQRDVREELAGPLVAQYARQLADLADQAEHTAALFEAALATRNQLETFQDDAGLLQTAGISTSHLAFVGGYSVIARTFGDRASLAGWLDEVRSYLRRRTR